MPEVAGDDDVFGEVSDDHGLSLRSPARPGAEGEAHGAEDISAASTPKPLGGHARSPARSAARSRVRSRVTSRSRLGVDAEQDRDGPLQMIQEDSSDTHLAVASAAVAIIVGGCTAVVCLESLLKVDNACGGLIQFAQTAFVSLECLRHNVELKPGASTYSLKERSIPLHWHGALVVMCFVGSLFSNMSHAYGVTVPNHVIFKSSSLAVNMAVGAVVLGKKYSSTQVAYHHHHHHHLCARALPPPHVPCD